MMTCRISNVERRLRNRLQRAVEIARKDGLDEERIGLAISGTLVALKAESYKLKSEEGSEK